MSQSDRQSTVTQEADRYRNLLEASQRLGAKLSPDELHEAIYREVSQVVSAPGFYLALYDQGRDLARVVYRAENGHGREVDVPFRGSDSGVITSQKSSVASDATPDAFLQALNEDVPDSATSAIVAPLMHNGRVIGVICAQGYEDKAYSDSELKVLEGIGSVAAVSIYNSQQFAELDRRRREAEQLEEIGRAMTGQLDPDQVVGLVISAVSDLLDVDGVAVWLKDPRKIGTCSVADSGGEVALPIGLEWELAGELLDRLFDLSEPVILDNLANSKDLPDHVAEHLTGGSAAGVPLVFGGQVEGVLTAGSRQAHRFTREDVAVLQRLASQACVALGNARLHALSLTDPLTALPNRRRLQVHLDHEVAAAHRGRPMSIAIFDIDNFKRYNDTFGHVAGDEILIALGQVLSAENRAMNIVARYGGDEFVSALPQTDIEGMQHFVERVRKRIGENETLVKFGISISIGCAEFDPETMTSVNDLLRAADADMYEAKVKRHVALKAEK